MGRPRKNPAKPVADTSTPTSAEATKPEELLVPFVPKEGIKVTEEQLQHDFAGSYDRDSALMMKRASVRRKDGRILYSPDANIRYREILKNHPDASVRIVKIAPIVDNSIPPRSMADFPTLEELTDYIREDIWDKETTETYEWRITKHSHPMLTKGVLTFRAQKTDEDDVAKNNQQPPQPTYPWVYPPPGYMPAMPGYPPNGGYPMMPMAPPGPPPTSPQQPPQPPAYYPPQQPTIIAMPVPQQQAQQPQYMPYPMPPAPSGADPDFVKSLIDNSMQQALEIGRLREEVNRGGRDGRLGTGGRPIGVSAGPSNYSAPANYPNYPPPYYPPPGYPPPGYPPPGYPPPPNGYGPPPGYPAPYPQQLPNGQVAQPPPYQQQQQPQPSYQPPYQQQQQQPPAQVQQTPLSQIKQMGDMFREVASAVGVVRSIAAEPSKEPPPSPTPEVKSGKIDLGDIEICTDLPFRVARFKDGGAVDTATALMLNSDHVEKTLDKVGSAIKETVLGIFDKRKELIEMQSKKDDQDVSRAEKLIQLKERYVAVTEREKSLGGPSMLDSVKQIVVEEKKVPVEQSSNVVTAPAIQANRAAENPMAATAELFQPPTPPAPKG